MLPPDSASAALRSARRAGDRHEEIAASPHISGRCERILPDAVREILRSPDRLWKPGKVLKPGSRSTVSLIEADGRSYVLKQYKSLALHRRLRYALTRTRAEQSWETGQAMAALGLPVARPLAVLVERRFGIPARAVLLMEHIEGPSLADLVEGSADSGTLRDIARQLRETFARMEDHHVVHGDLKASNIIIRAGGRVALIDIDAAEVAVSGARFRRLRGKDRLRFLRNWEKSPEAAEIFRGVFDKTPPPA